MKAALMSTLLLAITPSLAWAGTTFVDLTSQKYSGPDSDLSGFTLNKFGVNCGEDAVYTPGDPAYVSWESHIIKDAAKDGLKKTFRASTYTIHFRVKDRHGAIQTEEEFKYNAGIGYEKGYVLHDAYMTRCDRSGVRFSKKIDLSYATVEHWVSQIGWAEFTPNYGPRAVKAK